MASKKSSSKKASSSKRSSSKKVDATKTPAKASKKSKVEHRRPAPTIGDLAGAEFDPARTEEGERVAATGANPAASRAGQIAQIGEVGGEPGKADSGVKVAVVDGSSVTLTAGSAQVTLTKDDSRRLGTFLTSAAL